MRRPLPRFERLKFLPKSLRIVHLSLEVFFKQLERLQQQMASMQRIIEETSISERNRLQATANAGLRGSSSDSDLLPVSRKSDWNTAAAANAELAALSAQVQTPDMQQLLNNVRLPPHALHAAMTGMHDVTELDDSANDGYLKAAFTIFYFFCSLLFMLLY